MVSPVLELQDLRGRRMEKEIGRSTGIGTLRILQRGPHPSLTLMK
jgi:hypothetical protein